MTPALGAAELPFYEVHDGNGPFMLMQHGFLSSRAQWLPNLEELKGFCRPVITELWGHGRSPTPVGDEPYLVRNYVAAFEEIRSRLGAAKWVVCGQSFGAGLAIRYAMAHPERTYGLVVTNSLSAFSPAGDADRRAVTEERIRNLEREGRPALEALRIYPTHAKRLPADAKAQLVADAAGISIEAVKQSWLVTSPELNMQEELTDIPVPTLLVNGIWEKRFQGLYAAAKRLIPDLTVVELEGGHSINMEAPHAFNEAVRQFIARVSA